MGLTEPLALGALSIFTQAGLSVLIECSFQYRLVKDQVNITFAKYGINYNTGVSISSFFFI